MNRKLKNSLILMFLEDGPVKLSRTLKKIIKEISDNIIPIRPSRKFEKRMALKANKYSLNKKRAL